LLAHRRSDEKMPVMSISFSDRAYQIVMLRGKGHRSNFVSYAVVSHGQKDDDLPLLRVGDMRHIEGLGMAVWTDEGWELAPHLEESGRTNEPKIVDLNDEGTPDQESEVDRWIREQKEAVR
jgi:hypothetical protein